MGFWHTGYMEFHELNGFGDDYVPSAPEYPCQHCDAVFVDIEALRQHRFEKHPLSRPVLMINGREIGSVPFYVTSPLLAKHVHLLHCASVSVNGREMASASVGAFLSRIRNDVANLELSNQGVSATFSVHVEIAEMPDLAGVDKCFLSVARTQRLDMRAIEAFIAEAEEFRTASRYYGGICDYFYGVLAKERSPDSTLKYEDYREKFGRAAEKLKDFNRPPAIAIGALIAFHFNQFKEAAAMAKGLRLGVAAGRFERLLGGNAKVAGEMLSEDFSDDIEKLLTDVETEKLLAWSVLKPKKLEPLLKDLEAFSRRDIPETDRAKLRVLLGEVHVAIGAFDEAFRNARELRNSPAFAVWAEHLIDRIKKKEARQ